MCFMEQFANKKPNMKTRLVWLVAGIFGGLFGLLLAIPGYLNYNYPLAIIATIIIMMSIIIIAIVIGGAEDELD